MNRSIWCLVLVLLFGCNFEVEKPAEKLHKKFAKALDDEEAQGWQKFAESPPPEPLPTVELPQAATSVVKEGLRRSVIRPPLPPASPPPSYLPQTATKVEFLEDDPSPYLEFNVSDRVGRSQYSLKRIKMLQRICRAKSVESLEMCLGEQIDILLMHVEALEKENERRHKATAEFRKAIKKKR